MLGFKTYFYVFLFMIVFPFLTSQKAHAAIPDEKLSGTEIHQKLGTKIDLSLGFQDQNGEQKTLRDMFKGGKVLVVSLNYFRCTTMCTFQFLNMSEILNGLHVPGDKFQVASISFDPLDTVTKAKQTHDLWTPKAGENSGKWDFYVGNEKNISVLTKELSFYFEKDDEGNYSHAGALFFIKPDGTFYRYLYGIVYEKDDFNHALIDTSDGKLGSIFQKIAAKFKKYNPIRGKYISWI